MRSLPLLSLLPVTLLCCQQAADANRRPPADTQPPMQAVANAYEAAGQLELSKSPPMELPGLHNVFQLSERIVSGSEPATAEGFAQLQKLGIRTILSVDGSPPKIDLASRFGIRYVHVPIEYRGITDDEMRQIAKTFRELEGPFYVHCFHGKHRGPAAAAVGRCVLDGVTRQQAIAEMRQWMGTAPEYEGLYQAIATHVIPDAAATAAFAFDFPAVKRPDDFVAGMADLGRAFDNVKDLARRDFAKDPGHPDLDAANESEKVVALFRHLAEAEATKARKDDFRGWMAAAVQDATTLRDSIRQHRGGDADALQRAKAAASSLGKSCKSCHAVYRDD